MESRWVSVPDGRGDRYPVHTSRWAGAGGPGGDVVLCVHGLGGSHLNWALLAPLLAARPDVREVWAPDLAGFGLTPLGRRRSTLDQNLDLLARFAGVVAPNRRLLVVGNSMGGLLSLRLAARHPGLVRALALLDPASPPVERRPDPVVAAQFLAFLIPGVGESFLKARQRRLTPEQQTAATMALCAVDPAAIDLATIEATTALTAKRRTFPWAHTAFLQAARSILLAVGPGRGRYFQDVADVRAPTLLVQGRHDRLVAHASGARLASARPDWTFVVYEEHAHVPMLEAPAHVAADIDRLLAAARERERADAPDRPTTQARATG